ncbi:recombinase family protein [Streptomyces sp. NBC_00057]|uniref:recombinase family protein n=1 Tax=Streptomyces sp. NBC_00057 TaxID=2975634 RepID=UPI00324F260B
MGDCGPCLGSREILHLRIATGTWSGFDLAADDPQTKLFVTMLAGVREFQRDMISENTKEGVAAEAAGRTLGRPPRSTGTRRPTSSTRTGRRDGQSRSR